MAIALAASLSFLTPIGYQTNLMVMGPGGYRPGDYLRVGTPVALAVGVTANLLIPGSFRSDARCVRTARIRLPPASARAFVGPPSDLTIPGVAVPRCRRWTATTD